MFKYAVRIGIRPYEFWDMTPKEIFITGEIFYEDKQSAIERDLSIAYIASRLVMATKPPKLEALLEATRPKKEQTLDEMLQIVKQLNTLYGGEIKKEEVKVNEC